MQGLFPKEKSDKIVPYGWVKAAQDRWRKLFDKDFVDPEMSLEHNGALKLGVDIAGMGADATIFCHRYGNVVTGFEEFHSFGKADHVKYAGLIAQRLKYKNYRAFIDTIGEGSGVYSILMSTRKDDQVISAKFSHSAKGFRDITGEREFINMRAYCYWKLREWLDPKLNSTACLPPSTELAQQLCAGDIIINSKGVYQVEPKEDIKEKLGGVSPDMADALAETFYPNSKTLNTNDLSGIFY